MRALLSPTLSDSRLTPFTLRLLRLELEQTETLVRNDGSNLELLVLVRLMPVLARKADEKHASLASFDRNCLWLRLTINSFANKQMAIFVITLLL